MGVALRTDELHIHPHLVGRALHAAFENIGDPELLRDFGKVFGRALEVLRRSARDNLQVADFSEPRENFVLNAFSEIGILFVTAQVFEGQNGDGFLRNRSRSSR